MKIITVTLSPALDVTYALDAPVKSGLNRAESFVMSAGGKGINVSRAIAAADKSAPIMTIAPVGGDSGSVFLSILSGEGLSPSVVPVKSPLRINVSAIPRAGDDCEINAPGAALTAGELCEIEKRILSSVEEGDIVCVCGSCPSGVSAEYPAKLCAAVKRLGARCVMDCDGEALRNAVSAGTPPDIIKPNAAEQAELCRSLGIENSAAAILRYTGGKTAVITTLGERGAAVTYADLTGVISAEVSSRRVKPVRIKGAGDTFLGTFVYHRFICLESYERSAELASAAASDYVGSGGCGGRAF